MVFNATFSNISVISWRSVLLVEVSMLGEALLRSSLGMLGEALLRSSLGMLGEALLRSSLGMLGEALLRSSLGMLGEALIRYTKYVFVIDKSTFITKELTCIERKRLILPDLKFNPEKTCLFMFNSRLVLLLSKYSGENIY
jgi:hypothetical protein